MAYIFLYLSAAIIANLLITWFGPSASIPTAFLLIGLDLTSRDKLHDAWQNNGLIWKMILLIGTGSILSFILNRNSGTIAIASFSAFALAATVDTIVYHLLREKIHLVKINGSNIVSAAVDSIIFPTFAFGIFLPWIVLGQFAAKVGGGFIWSIILNLKTKNKVITQEE